MARVDRQINYFFDKAILIRREELSMGRPRKKRGSRRIISTNSGFSSLVDRMITKTCQEFEDMLADK